MGGWGRSKKAPPHMSFKRLDPLALGSKELETKGSRFGTLPRSSSREVRVSWYPIFFSSVAFCSPASLTFGGLVEDPLIGKKLKSYSQAKCTKVSVVYFSRGTLPQKRVNGHYCGT